MKQLIFLSILFVLAGCKTNEAPSQSLNVTYQGESYTLEQSKVVNGFVEALANKRKVLVKRMPDFEYRVTLDSAKTQSIWYLSKSGYVKQDSKKSAEIYQIDFTASQLNLPSK